MSYTLLQTIEAAALPPREKVVLLRLVRFGQADGSAIFPSVARVADETGYSMRTIHRSLDWLSSRGLLETIGHRPRARTVEYRLVVERLERGGPWTVLPNWQGRPKFSTEFSTGEPPKC